MIAPNTLRRTWRRLLLLAALAIAAANTYAGTVVIVSAKSTVAGLTPEQIAKIFLGKVDTYPNGLAAYPIDQAEGSAARNAFYRKVCGKSPAQLAAYWAKMVFTGDARPPALVEGNEAVRNAVADNPHAIGYIDKSAVNGSVRVILSIDVE